MFRYLYRKIEELLLPERQTNGTRYLEPMDALRLIYHRIFQLAEQIESHAELAPYPQVAEHLRRIADEKRDTTNRLKQIIEAFHGSITEEELQLPATGKNHWQRLNRDLEDQRKLDDLLSRYEFPVSRQFPQVSDFFRELKAIHEAHRRSLAQLTAAADPQATQT
jgi:hypothetical protein